MKFTYTRTHTITHHHTLPPLHAITTFHDPIIKTLIPNASQTMALQALSQSFLGAFERRNYTEAVSYIPKIKLEYAKAGLLTPSSAFDQTDLEAARQLLEMAVIVSVHAGCSLSEVKRVISEVRPFYNPSLHLSPSENENKILGLYLLLVLTSNEISEFHAELENLDDTETDKYLRYPIHLERWLMEGAYDKAWTAITDKQEFPSPEFALLMQNSESNLEATIQNEIALCAESAYTSLPIASAKNLLHITSDAALEQFVAARQDQGWSINQQSVVFRTAPNVAVEEEQSEEQLIDKMLDYAANIEGIV